METKLYGLCIKAIDYKEKDKLVTIACFNKGKITAKLRNGADSKIKFCAYPLCFAEYIFSQTQNSYTIIGTTIEDSFFSCWDNITKNAACGIVLDLLDKAIYSGEEVDEILLMAINTIKAIAYKESYAFLYVLQFLEKVMRENSIDTLSLKISEEMMAIINFVINSTLDELESSDFTQKSILETVSLLSKYLEETCDINLKSITKAIDAVRML